LKYEAGSRRLCAFYGENSAIRAPDDSVWQGRARNSRQTPDSFSTLKKSESLERKITELGIAMARVGLNQFT